jgi:monoamine oxidase
MFTRRNFNAEGMFCELGGELVDTNHAALIALAEEVGVGVERLAPETDAGEDLYVIGAHVYAERDMLARGRGAFAAIARQIAVDRAALTDENDNWTDRARALDSMSVRAYLDQFRKAAPDWPLALLDIAYRGEYGMPTDQQSALNLVDLIGADPSGDFAMFGDSDEAWRVRGGSSGLTDALLAKLGPRVTLRPRHELKAIAKTASGVRLRFAAPGGATEAEYATAVLALPFTMLRLVEGLDALALSPQKRRAIAELGYGDNAKLIVGTRGRPWRESANGVPLSGEFYSDQFQVAWDTSRAQPGSQGVLTNFLTGVAEPAPALARLQSGLRAISPAIADSLDSANVASFFWGKHPYTRGSYAGAKIGQYTTLLESAGTPELDGRLHFAGEHASADFLGFMNGGVDSGERVASALLGAGAQRTAG